MGGQLLESQSRKKMSKQTHTEEQPSHSLKKIRRLVEIKFVKRTNVTYFLEDGTFQTNC